MAEVGSHFGDKLDGDYFVLLIVVVAHLYCCFNDVLFLLRGQPVLQRRENSVRLLFYLG